MAQQVLLTTTSVNVTIDDVGGKTFIHPTINQDLLAAPNGIREFDREELSASNDLQAAIDANLITLKDENGVAILNIDVIFDRILNNRLSVIDPTVNDDLNSGYSKSSTWLNLASGFLYYCEDNSAGAAIWRKVKADSSGLSGFDEFFDFGEKGGTEGLGDKFVKCTVSGHTSLDSTYLALHDGQVVSCTCSTEELPNNIFDLQIITNAVKNVGSAPFQGGTQIGTNLTKPAGVLDKIFTGLTGFNFLAGDRIALYIAKNPDSAEEPVIRLHIKYDK